MIKKYRKSVSNLFFSPVLYISSTSGVSTNCDAQTNSKSAFLSFFVFLHPDQADGSRIQPLNDDRGAAVLGTERDG